MGTFCRIGGYFWAIHLEVVHVSFSKSDFLSLAAPLFTSPFPLLALLWCVPRIIIIICSVWVTYLSISNNFHKILFSVTRHGNNWSLLYFSKCPPPAAMHLTALALMSNIALLIKDLSKIPIGFPTNQSYICHSWFSLNSLFFETPCICTVYTVYMLQLMYKVS